MGRGKPLPIPFHSASVAVGAPLSFDALLAEHRHKGSVDTVVYAAVADRVGVALKELEATTMAAAATAASVYEEWSIAGDGW
jgi:hypothetical protein